MNTLRTIRALSAFLIIGLLSVLPAKAAYLYLEPGDGSFEVPGGSTFVVDLFFNLENDPTFSISSFAYDFVFDPAEVVFQNASLLSSWNFFPNSPTVTANQITVKASSFAPLAFSNNSPQKLMSLAFSVISPAHSYDDAADVQLLSQSGVTNRGMTTPFVVGGPSPVTYKYDGAAGPDVGASPVPVPAALWLLGSGVAVLAGLRKKAV